MDELQIRIGVQRRLLLGRRHLFQLALHRGQASICCLCCAVVEENQLMYEWEALLVVPRIRCASPGSSRNVARLREGARADRMKSELITLRRDGGWRDHHAAL